MIAIPGVRRLFPLSYSIQRNIDIPYLAFFVLIIGAVILTLSTIGGLITSGYQYVAVLSNDFNATLPMWYDRFGGGWAPVSRYCQGSLMKPGESTTLHVWEVDAFSAYDKHHHDFLAST